MMCFRILCWVAAFCAPAHSASQVQELNMTDATRTKGLTHDKKRSILTKHFKTEFALAAESHELFQDVNGSERHRRKKYCIDVMLKGFTDSERVSLETHLKVPGSIKFSLAGLESYLARGSGSATSSSIKLAGDAADDVPPPVGAPASSSSEDKLEVPLSTPQPGRYAGSLPKCPATKKALSMFREDMGKSVRMQLRLEGVSKDMMSNAVAARLTKLFKVQEPAQIASYYRKAGFNAPAGIAEIQSTPLTSDEREWGNAAYADLWWENMMKTVFVEDRRKCYSKRRAEARSRLRADFNKLAITEQRSLALSRRLRMSP